MIRIQELISIRNQSRDSFIVIKLNTLHSWKEYVESLIRISIIIHLIGHLSMMQMFSFNFRVLISDSRAHFHSEAVQRFIYFNTIEHFTLMERVCWESILISGIGQLIGHISMMQMFSFNFRVLIRIQELISIRNQSRDSFILLKMNTLHSWKE